MVTTGALRRQRIALSAVFAMHGFVFANWAVRVPAIKQQTGASTFTLGLALLSLSAGAVVVQLLAGPLCRRVGSRRVTVGAAAVLSAAVLLPPLAHAVDTLAPALLVVGGAYGCLNVAMNSVAVEIVAAIRRPIMPSFHAAWSFGGLAGASAGGLLAPHLAPFPHLALVGLIGALVTLVTAPVLLAGLVAARADATGAEQADVGHGLGMRSSLRLACVFGIVALAASYDEGAIGDWAALHLKQDLAAGAGLAATGYAVFALAEATGRLSGTAVLARYGHTRVLIAGSLTAGGGILLAAFAPRIWLALIGFALTGAGLANLFPTVVARAGAVAGASGVALTATFGYTGFLVGPPLIGFLAARFSLRVGLATLAALALTTTVTAYLTRRKGSLASGFRLG